MFGFPIQRDWFSNSCFGMNLENSENFGFSFVFSIPVSLSYFALALTGLLAIDFAWCDMMRANSLIKASGPLLVPIPWSHQHPSDQSVLKLNQFGIVMSEAKTSPRHTSRYPCGRPQKIRKRLELTIECFPSSSSTISSTEFDLIRPRYPPGFSCSEQRRVPIA